MPVPGGLWVSQRVELVHQAWAWVVPKKIRVAPVVSKLVPLTITWLPPAGALNAGESEFTVGGGANGMTHAPCACDQYACTRIPSSRSTVLLQASPISFPPLMLRDMSHA